MLFLTMYCSFLFINDRVWWMYMFVYTLYKLSMSVYGYVFVRKCKLCLPVFVRWTCVVLYIYMNHCCKLTGSPSLIELKYCCLMSRHKGRPSWRLPVSSLTQSCNLTSISFRESILTKPSNDAILYSVCGFTMYKFCYGFEYTSAQ